MEGQEGNTGENTGKDIPPSEEAPLEKEEIPEEPPLQEPPPQDPSPPEQPPPPEEARSETPAKVSSWELKTSEQKSPSVKSVTISPSPDVKTTGDMDTSKETEEIISKRDMNRVAADGGVSGGGGGFSITAIPGLGNLNRSAFLKKRSPFIHNPPQPEERRDRIPNPRTPREYIINLRENLADFQESHGLPRSRDYTFLSLGMALLQETARALCSLFLMVAELFPIVAIVSLLMRFALDKLIDILETPEAMPKAKKSVIFALEMLVIIIPLWILIGTIIIPLLSLILTIFKRMLRIKGRGKKHPVKTKACSTFDMLRLFY